MNRQLKDQEQMIKSNQLELKATLQDLLDTEKYLRLIEDRNNVKLIPNNNQLLYLLGNLQY